MHSTLPSDSAYPSPAGVPSLADMWHEFAAVPGRLGDVPADGLAPRQPMHYEAPAAVGLVPSIDAPGWRVMRNLLQLAFVAGVLAFVLAGPSAPLPWLTVAVAGIALMVCLAVVDRRRFDASSAAVVQVVAPFGVQRHVDAVVLQQVAAPQAAPAMPLRLDVT